MSPSSRARFWPAVLPVVIAGTLAVLPAPPGLAPHAWYFAAIFAGVLAALILEPLPGGAVGLIGVALAAALGRWVLFSPAELAKAGFNAPNAALAWALSGFANSTVWLIFAAFMFALGYEKTGLGRRLALRLVQSMGRHTLTLGYAVVAADLLLAPFTPSNTARSAGTIYPIVRNLPGLFGSRPNDPSARRLGSYLMWVAIAGTSVTSSMFLTGLATNLLALELVRQTAGLTLGWTEWCVAFLPVGVPLLLLVPVLTWWLYPPEVRSAPEVVAWAREELARMGPVARAEWTLGVLVAGALACWVFGAEFINPTLAALAVIALLVVTDVLAWDDIVAHKTAWNTLVWFATLVAMADGLNRTGFVPWLADVVVRQLSGVSPTAATAGLVAVFFVIHYLFASTTAHATALLPVFLAVGSTLPGVVVRDLALLLSFSLGLMGIITPYATGPSPIYASSGYLPTRDYWRLGAMFGAIYLTALILLSVCW
jgi:L-tartrate/succinate antiporter